MLLKLGSTYLVSGHQMFILTTYLDFMFQKVWHFRKHSYTSLILSLQKSCPNLKKSIVLLLTKKIEKCRKNPPNLRTIFILKFLYKVFLNKPTKLWEPILLMKVRKKFLSTCFRRPSTFEIQDKYFKLTNKVYVQQRRCLSIL